MNNSKENILKRIAAAGMPEYAYPDFGYEPQHFDDPAAMFAQRLRAAGGEAVWLDGATTLDEVVRRCYPDAKSVASALPEVTLATVNPDRVEDPRELVDIDLGVVSGAFGVAENGAVWIPQDIRHKALYFGATALMVVIPRDALVDTMHEAVVRPKSGTSPTGVSCRALRRRPTSNRRWYSAPTGRCPSPSCCADRLPRERGVCHVPVGISRAFFCRGSRLFRGLVFPVRIFYLCRMTTELCAYSVEACETARRAGVTRVELCASPYEGGTTPSAAAIRMARRIGGLQLSVMVRPRGGDFLYSDTEFRQMLEEVRFARECGADGVVFGVLTPPRRAGRRAAYGCPGRRGGADADHLSPGVSTWRATWRRRSKRRWLPDAAGS